MTSQVKMFVIGPVHLTAGLLLAWLWWPTPSRFGEWAEVESVVTGTEGTLYGNTCKGVVRRYEYRRDGAIVAARGPYIQAVERNGECDDRLPAWTRVIVAIDPGDPHEVRSRQDEADLRSSDRGALLLAGIFAVAGFSVTAIAFVRLRTVG